MRTTSRILAVAAAVALAAITGCTAESGSSSAPPAASSSPSPAPAAEESAGAREGVITIRDFAYEGPASVRPGSMVTVTNADSAPHTLTAKGKGGFDIEVPGGGTVIFQAPNAPGKYEIICTFHPQMNGTLVVE